MISPEEAVQALRNLRQQIPLPSGEVTAVTRRRRVSHVDAKFIEVAISAVGVSAGVQQSLGRTDADLREDVDATARWTTVADEVRSLLESIIAANMVRRTRIGLAALQTYQICQQIARDERNDSLSAYIKEMKRLNKFGRSRRKASPPDDPTKPPQPIAA
jgi:hypothetical protein